MVQDIQKQIKLSRKGMGDYTRLILAFYICLILLGVYQQISLYSAGVIDSVIGFNLVLLLAHHLGFTALLSLFLYFTFNALETLKPGLGLRATAGLLMVFLLFEGILTMYYVRAFEMPGVKLWTLWKLANIPGELGVSVFWVSTALVLTFYGLYRLSAPMQMWMGRVYPFTLAVFSLFLATLLATSAPLSENKIKYVLVDAYQQTFEFKDAHYAVSSQQDPLENIYRLEQMRVWERNQQGMRMTSPAGNPEQTWISHDFIQDPFSDDTSGEIVYPKAEKQELIRIQSNYQGRNYDKAFEKARELAQQGAYDRAISLCTHILSEAPDHVDAEILLGRIFAWKAEYSKSAAILEQAIRKQPHYQDAYSALLDTYYWGGDPIRSLSMKPFIDTHFKGNEILKEKLERAKEQQEKAIANPQAGRFRNTANLPVS